MPSTSQHKDSLECMLQSQLSYLNHLQLRNKTPLTLLFKQELRRRRGEEGEEERGGGGGGGERRGRREEGEERGGGEK